MIFIHKKSATVARIPTLAFMILGPWALLAVPAWLVGQPMAPKLHGYFALGFALVVILGTKLVRREPGLITVRSLRGTKSVSERQARLGVIARGGGRYWGTHLELMPAANFVAGSVPKNVLEIETFSSTETDKPMHVARRIARALELQEPLLAPWLVDTSARSLDGDSAAPSPKAPPARRSPFKWNTPIVAILALGVAGLAWTSWLRRNSGEVLFRCKHPRPLRSTFDVPEFSGEVSFTADSGTVTVGVWNGDRKCWIVRNFSVFERKRTVVDVDDIATGECSVTDWPAP